MDPGSCNIKIAAQLQALNRTWCIDGRNAHEDGMTTGDTGVVVDGAGVIVSNNLKYHLHQKNKQMVTLTPLEKARLAISKFLPPTLSDKTRGRIDFIVPYIFSVLAQSKDSIRKDENNENKSPSTLKISSTSSDRNATNEYELRQMEWHIVLLLELWSCVSSSTDERSPSKIFVLETITISILFYRDQLRKKDMNGEKKKKKKRKKKKDSRKDPIGSAKTMSEKAKDTLFNDHLTQILSKAPFLLPSNVPFSEFLINRIFSSDRHFSERLQHVVSYVFETFEITNPFLSKAENDESENETNDTLLWLSSNTDKKTFDSTRNPFPGGEKIHAKETSSDKKRKPSREKLQAITKNKKRRRLASLTSKKRNRGSHFHRNFDDISKLLERKKTKFAPSSSGGKKNIYNSDESAAATIEARKVGDKKFIPTAHQTYSKKAVPSIRKKIEHETKTKNHVSVKAANRINTENILKRSRSVQTNNEFPKTDLSQRILRNRSENSTCYTDIHDTNRSSNKGSNTEVLPMTPRKTVGSYTASVVGETPVPRNSNTIVEETPVTSGLPRFSDNIVGETPTSENNSVTTPRMQSASDYHSFSLLALPSPTKLSASTTSAEETIISRKQPAKLFGTVKLSKRTNSNASMGKVKKWEGNGQYSVTNNAAAKSLSRTEVKSGFMRDGEGPSAIEKARAFLRSKTL